MRNKKCSLSHVLALCINATSIKEATEDILAKHMVLTCVKCIHCIELFLFLETLSGLHGLENVTTATINTRSTNKQQVVTSRKGVIYQFWVNCPLKEISDDAAKASQWNLVRRNSAS